MIGKFTLIAVTLVGPCNAFAQQPEQPPPPMVLPGHVPEQIQMKPLNEKFKMELICRYLGTNKRQFDATFKIHKSNVADRFAKVNYSLNIEVIKSNNKLLFGSFAGFGGEGLKSIRAINQGDVQRAHEKGKNSEGIEKVYQPSESSMVTLKFDLSYRIVNSHSPAIFTSEIAGGIRPFFGVVYALGFCEINPKNSQSVLEWFE